MTSSLTVQRISSLEQPSLRPYRTLRRPREHLEQGVFVAEGEKVVRRLLASGLPTVSILLTEEWFDRISEGHYKLPPDVFIGDKHLLETIVGFRMHQGIMAVGRVPTEKSLDDLVSSSAAPRLFVALDGLMLAENVGVIVRNCAAFGVQAILVGSTSASPYLRRAVRNSMGAVFQTPVVHLSRLAASLHELHASHRMQIVAAHLGTTATILDARFQRDTCLIFGNEESGPSPEVLATCTRIVKIQMASGTDSLNVANASAVFLYEVVRQRSAHVAG